MRRGRPGRPAIRHAEDVLVVQRQALVQPLLQRVHVDAGLAQAWKELRLLVAFMPLHAFGQREHQRLVARLARVGGLQLADDLARGAGKNSSSSSAAIRWIARHRASATACMAGSPDTWCAKRRHSAASARVCPWPWDSMSSASGHEPQDEAGVAAAFMA